jgi:hypothetical protein
LCKFNMLWLGLTTNTRATKHILYISPFLWIDESSHLYCACLQQSLSHTQHSRQLFLKNEVLVSFRNLRKHNIEKILSCCWCWRAKHSSTLSQYSLSVASVVCDRKITTFLS